VWRLLRQSLMSCDSAADSVGKVRMVEIRPANAADLTAIVEIYNHYVLNSFAVFDETPLLVQDRVDWFETFDLTGPYRLLVAEDHHSAVGYACSNPYRPHVSFTKTVEFSIHLSPGRTGQGLGTQLYTRLLDDLRPEHLHRAVVGIALPNETSVRLHRRFGFQDVGIFDEYAKKWDKYVSSLWMQREL
jgi:phosphinothricin acetyltransferase